jgi:large subunit ribosomal protein L3
MAGRFGNDRVTVKNLEVIRVDQENNQIFVKGAVPGAKNGTIYLVK